MCKQGERLFLAQSGFARVVQFRPWVLAPVPISTIDLFPASTLVRAQTAYRALDAVATWLPWITLLLLAPGVYLARHRRRAVLGSG